MVSSDGDVKKKVKKVSKVVLVVLVDSLLLTGSG